MLIVSPLYRGTGTLRIPCFNFVTRQGERTMPGCCHLTKIRGCGRESNGFCPGVCRADQAILREMEGLDQVKELLSRAHHS
jgi:hypothetical protein